MSFTSLGQITLVCCWLAGRHSRQRSQGQTLLNKVKTITRGRDMMDMKRGDDNNNKQNVIIFTDL